MPGSWYGPAAALLVGLNLRPGITAVASLLPRYTEQGVAHVSLLATLPVIAFGLTGPVGMVVARRIGIERALIASMLLLAGGTVLRSLHPLLLLPGTFLVGVAIMAGSTLLPALIKSLSASAAWLGVFTMTYGIGAAIGAFVTPVIEAATGSVALASSVWAVVALVALVPLMAVDRRQGPGRLRPERAGRIPREMRPTVIGLTAVFGLQALLYFGVTNWLPPFLGDRGHPIHYGGSLLAAFSLVGLIPTLVTPMVAARRSARWTLPVALGALIAGGFFWLQVSTVGGELWPVLLLGITQSAAFALAMTLIVQKAADARSAMALSASSQGIGYAVAGVGAYGLGALRDWTGDWNATLLTMSGLALALGVAALLAARARSISLPDRPRTGQQVG